MRPWLLAFLLVAVSASGQEPARRVAPPQASAAARPAYAYNPEGRRDPFVSLLRRGRDTVRRPDGKVLDGVRIGRDVVVGANAVVNADLPDGAIAAGVPARVLRLRAGAEPAGSG